MAHAAGGITEESLKGAGTRYTSQGTENIQWPLTLGPLESQHLDATIQRTLKTFTSFPSVSAPKIAITEKGSKGEGRKGEQRVHQSPFTLQVPGSDYACLGMMRLVGIGFHRV